MKFVVDTSAIIKGKISELIKEGKIKNELIIPNAVVSELENQANKRQTTGEIGLEELKKINELAKKNQIKISFLGERPNDTQIKLAKAGEIDAMIRQIAVENKAILITCDRVQAASGKAYGLNVIYFEPIPKSKLKIEEFFDEDTMSVHLKEGVVAYAKKGSPRKWSYDVISKKELTKEEIINIAKEIIEYTRVDDESYIESEKKGIMIVQYKRYRIIITEPPFSDGWEITAVKPIKKLTINDYKISNKLKERLKEKAEGILISGSPGSGKSTFAQALAEFYLEMGKIVKTIESPRDLILPKEVTQYSKNYVNLNSLRDLLLLTRPDYTIFDEVRNKEDFHLFTDLRLSGIGLIGVIHASEPKDAIQRFVRRLDLGMIPSVIDTVIFIDKGKIKKVLSLNMRVKVPIGMKKKDLSRPIVEIRDFLTNKLEFEMYTYGDETVIIPTKEKKERRR